MTLKTTHQSFVEAYNHISIREKDFVIPFKPEWNNGTGYFDGLAREKLDMVAGTRFTTNTGGENNRKIVGIVTPVGNVVFFERYTAGQNGVICLNLPRELDGLYSTGIQDVEVFEQAIGGPSGHNRNIGHVLRNAIGDTFQSKQHHDGFEVILGQYKTQDGTWKMAAGKVISQNNLDLEKIQKLLIYANNKDLGLIEPL